METFFTPIAEISFSRIDSILHIKVLANAEMNLDNTRIHYRALNDLVKEKSYYALVDASNCFSIDKDAWEYASLKDVISNRKAIAHYNSSLANRITTLLYKASYGAAVPVAIFKTKENALKWLMSFVERIDPIY